MYSPETWVDKMDEDEKKSGSKKRSKLIEVNHNSDDDEPIGSLLKLKRQRNLKKVKPGLEGERGKKVEAGEEDLGGLDDTLASFRKKLKGPKKDYGAGTVRGRSSSLDVVQSSDPSANGHVEDGGSDAKSVLRSMEKGPVRGDVRSDVIMAVEVENKLKGKGKRPKVSGSLVSGEGSNSSLDHHLEDSLSAFFQKAQSGVTKKSHPSSSLIEKSGFQDLEDGLSLSSVGVGGNIFPVAVQRHSSVSKLTYENPSCEDRFLFDSGLNPLDSVSDQYTIEEHQNFNDRFCQDSDRNRENQDRSQGLYSIPDEMMRLDDKKNEAIGDPSGLNVQEGPCSSDKVNGGDSQHLQKTQTFENRLRHCFVANSSTLMSRGIEMPKSIPFSEQKGEVLGLGDSDSKGGSHDAFSIQSKDVLARCTSGADCEISSSAGKEILTPHYNDDLLNKSCENTSKEKNLVVSLSHLPHNSLTCHLKMDDELDSDQCWRFPQHAAHNFAPDTLKMEETRSNCNHVIAYTEGQDLASSSLQEENAVIADSRISSIQLSHQAKASQTTSIQKGSYCEELSSDEASKERIIPNHDFVTSNEEVDGTSPPLYATLDENESCPEDTVSLPDIENKDSKLSALQRAPRNIRKRRHGDMAYEGDVDWDISINDQGLDSDNSIRARVKFDSSSSIGTEAESGGAAAVSAGLKAHAVGPVEKIKFKEILKRRGGLQDYLECRLVINSETLRNAEL